MLPQSVLFNHRGHREHGGTFQAEKKILNGFPRLSTNCKTSFSTPCSPCPPWLVPRHPRGSTNLKRLPSPHPIEAHLLSHLRMQAQVDGATTRRIFQKRALRMLRRERNRKNDRQLGNSPGRLRGHFFKHLHRCLPELDSMPTRSDTHDRQHAGAKRCRRKIGRRKRLAASFIVHRCIRGNYCSRRLMPRLATQVSQILNRNFNHERSLNKPPRPLQSPLFRAFFLPPAF